jgi:nucleotide-binding universal stress UspA family protein
MMKYPKYRKVVFCADFSENADYAFEFAHGIAKRDKGRLYILHVIPENPYQTFAESCISKDTVEKMRKELKENLDDNYKEHYVKRIDNSIPVEIVTKYGREDDEIVKFAKQEKADIIVMGTHGRTGIEHVIFGSVAEKVLRHSPFPVFIIPCKKKLERS